MIIKLNRWQRIGVVISILWSLGAAYYERSAEMESGQHILSLNYRACMEIERVNIETCSAQMQKEFDIWMKPNWGNISFIAFAPIILGWILVFISIRVHRWIKAGKT